MLSIRVLFGALFALSYLVKNSKFLPSSLLPYLALSLLLAVHQGQANECVNWYSQISKSLTQTTALDGSKVAIDFLARAEASKIDSRFLFDGFIAQIKSNQKVSEPDLVSNANQKFLAERPRLDLVSSTIDRIVSRNKELEVQIAALAPTKSSWIKPFARFSKGSQQEQQIATISTNLSALKSDLQYLETQRSQFDSLYDGITKDEQKMGQDLIIAKEYLSFVSNIHETILRESTRFPKMEQILSQRYDQISSLALRSATFVSRLEGELTLLGSHRALLDSSRSLSLLMREVSNLENLVRLSGISDSRISERLMALTKEVEEAHSTDKLDATGVIPEKTLNSKNLLASESKMDTGVRLSSESFQEQIQGLGWSKVENYIRNSNFDFENQHQLESLSVLKNEIFEYTESLKYLRQTPWPENLFIAIAKPLFDTVLFSIDSPIQVNALKALPRVAAGMFGQQQRPLSLQFLNFLEMIKYVKSPDQLDRFLKVVYLDLPINANREYILYDAKRVLITPVSSQSSGTIKGETFDLFKLNLFYIWKQKNTWFREKKGKHTPDDVKQLIFAEIEALPLTVQQSSMSPSELLQLARLLDSPLFRFDPLAHINRASNGIAVRTMQNIFIEEAIKRITESKNADLTFNLLREWRYSLPLSYQKDGLLMSPAIIHLFNSTIESKIWQWLNYKVESSGSDIHGQIKFIDEQAYSIWKKTNYAYDPVVKLVTRFAYSFQIAQFKNLSLNALKDYRNTYSLWYNKKLKNVADDSDYKLYCWRLMNAIDAEIGSRADSR